MCTLGHNREEGHRGKRTGDKGKTDVGAICSRHAIVQKEVMRLKT